MKISILVPGRFHAFNLAYELQKQNVLHCLVTSYPYSEVKKYGIKKEYVKSVVSKEIIQRIFLKLFKTYPPFALINRWFGYLASYKLPMDSDIYVLWSGVALWSIKRIRKKNPKAKIIIERGSSHIQKQDELLKLVYKKNIVSKHVIEIELKEYDLADYISIPSIFAQNSFIEKGFKKEKLLLNNYGVDLKDFYPIEENTSSIDKNELIVGYAGYLSARKNINGLIESLEELNIDGYNIKLYLIGSIDKSSFNQKTLTKNFIKYFEKVPQKELIQFYQQIDVFVQNSVEEGLSMVILQAMACGKPIIATENSGAADFIENGKEGFIIPIMNNFILKEKIKYFYENKSVIKQFGDSSILRVKKGFTWEDYGSRAIKIYNKIL
ncbi:MAG: glycosyltransferase family 4 protein [Bacteroidia bacterium]